MKEIKTNAMRFLDQKKINYNVYEYESGGVAIDGIEVARRINKDVKNVYKTLVTRGHSKSIYVFVIPVDKTIDLKKAAKVVKEKSIEMIAVSEINGLTGYVRGGCSPIGMKKNYKTVINNTCLEIDSIVFSGGKIGCQIEMNPSDLIKLINCNVDDVINKE